MPEQPFSALQKELLDSGIAPKYVRRIVAELADHQEDLQGEALAQGFTAAEAADHAARRIGSQQVIAAQMLASPQLKCWVHRYPRVARLYLPLAYALLLPAAPVFAGLANPGIVFRWGAALMLSAGITAAMFLSMQLAIALT